MDNILPYHLYLNTGVVNMLAVTAQPHRETTKALES